MRDKNKVLSMRTIFSNAVAPHRQVIRAHELDRISCPFVASVWIIICVHMLYTWVCVGANGAVSCEYSVVSKTQGRFPHLDGCYNLRPFFRYEKTGEPNGYHAHLSLGLMREKEGAAFFSLFGKKRIQHEKPMLKKNQMAFLKGQKKEKHPRRQ